MLFDGQICRAVEVGVGGQPGLRKCSLFGSVCCRCHSKSFHLTLCVGQHSFVWLGAVIKGPEYHVLIIVRLSLYVYVAGWTGW